MFTPMVMSNYSPVHITTDILIKLFHLYQIISKYYDYVIHVLPLCDDLCI